ncbi:Phosphate transport system regulatory protein PhoU [hydrothermal vent metagenome]|uniref:Phosphate transport system regulatory protein PhoU n=1 Tax=hydrothermal vent metagenome TaxID=652676 RepID=A0A3B0UBH0_9ZZZZ
MTLKKDDAIESILTDFESFANLVLYQLDILEAQISSGDVSIRDKTYNEIVDNEKKLDKMEVKISDKIVKTIVLYKPVASDIRRIIACYRIVISLERVGDLVMNIINFLKKIKNPKVYADLSDVIANMLIFSTNMVKKSLLSFTHDDKEFAIWTIKNDSVVDELNHKLMKKAINKSKVAEENKLLLLSFININEIVSNIERIADHATNIAEAAIYSFEGKDIRHLNKDIE